MSTRFHGDRRPAVDQPIISRSAGWTRRHVLGVCLGAAVAASGHPLRAASAQSAETIEFGIESPAPGSVVAGTVDLTGWALDRAATDPPGIAIVRFYLGGDSRTGSALGEAKLGLPSPAAAQRFGRPFTNAGFSLAWDTTAVTPGPINIVGYAQTDANAWRSINVEYVVERPKAIAVSAEMALEFIELPSPIAPGSMGRVVARTEPSAQGVILVSSPAGPVMWSGLGPASADGAGRLVWEVRPPANSPRGVYEIAALATLGRLIATARAEFIVG